jgi:Fur family transcriptional regulator, ferric uptake regulator
MLILTEKELENILIINQLKITDCRLKVLNIFIEMAGKGIDEYFISQRINHQFDRVTIYRTLLRFLERNIIHKVVGDGMIRYAYSDVSRRFSHIHFQCIDCQEIVCMNQCKIDEIELPQGFEAFNYFILAKGVCKHCQMSN